MTAQQQVQEAVAEVVGINGRNGVEIHWLAGPVKIGDLLYTAPVTAAPVEPKSPSYDGLLLMMQSVCGALSRAGLTDCDDPGEAIDVIRERLERRVAELERQLLARTPAAPGIDLRQFRDAVVAWSDKAYEESHNPEHPTIQQADRLLALIDGQADASQNGSHCATCNGHGMVGGLLPVGGGYESDPCPDCSGPSIARQFDRAVLDPMRQEAKASRPEGGSEARQAGVVESDALIRALADYPRRNTHQLQAAKVCAGVLKLAMSYGAEAQAGGSADNNNERKA